MSRRLSLRGAVGIAALVTLASVARADAPIDQYALFDMTDVTIQDAFTQLVWQRYPTTATMTFDQAAAYCQGLSLGSYTSSWRVPSYKELLTLVDEKPHLEFENGQLVAKAIDMRAFGVGSGGAVGTPTAGGATPSYWTSSSPGSASADGYSVSFSNGTSASIPKAAPLYVRCVH